MYFTSINEDKLVAKERNSLDDSTFGIPSQRRYLI